MNLKGFMKQQEDLDNYLIIAAENNPGLKAKFNDYMAKLEPLEDPFLEDFDTIEKIFSN